MAQRSVEIRLGKLVTDEEIRQRFLDKLAAALPPRLQKASLQCPSEKIAESAESAGGRRRPRR